MDCEGKGTATILEVEFCDIINCEGMQIDAATPFPYTSILYESTIGVCIGFASRRIVLNRMS